MAKIDLDFDFGLAKFTERQIAAIDLLDSGAVKFLLYGGAVGGGKSYFLRWYAVRRLITLAGWGIKEPVGMIACENYPTLKDRQLSKVGREFPEWLGTLHQDHKEYGRCYILNKRFGGGVICFRNLDDPSKYASAEFCFILVDELTKNDYDTFTFLRMRLRWPGLPDVEAQFVGATNPGDIGHAWCKQLFHDKDFPEEFKSPVDYTNQFAYVPSKADDNPHIDASYWAMLQTLPEHVRKAFRDGDWNVFLGQAFTFSRDLHVIPRMPIPESAPLYMTMDWGYGAPFSVGWWWVDGDNRVYRCSEWYGWNGQPNQGLRLTDDEVAQGIIEREEALGIRSRQITRLAGPDCFQKRPDYRGGGQGPSTAEVFSKHGLFLVAGDPSRSFKIRQFRDRLFVPKDGTMPMLVVYDCCDQFIRTVPNLVTDKHNIEDIDTKGEDHCFHGDTKIITPDGPRSLSSLDGTCGLVLVADGSFAEFHGCRRTKSNAWTVAVTFDDGSVVRCTPDHEFLTMGGVWVEAIDLLDETCYTLRKIRGGEAWTRLLLAKKAKSFKASGTGYVDFTTSAKARGCTVRYGSRRTDLFRRALRSTIATVIATIIGLTTWSWSRMAATRLFMGANATRGDGNNPCETVPQDGMAQKMAKPGTGSTTNYTVVPPLSGLSEPARSVEKSTWLSRRTKQIFAARDDAVAATTARRVIDVELHDKADVYCITVPGWDSFVLENGVVVGNCYDEACHICMARPISMPAPKPPPPTQAQADFSKITGDETILPGHGGRAVNLE